MAGIPISRPRPEFPKASLEETGSGKFVITYDGKYATRSGDWIVFQDPGNADSYQYEIEIDGNGYAKMAGYWMCVEGNGYFNLKRSGAWVTFRDIDPAEMESQHGGGTSKFDWDQTALGQ